MSEWGTAIAALLTLIGWGLNQWLVGAPARKKEAEDEAIQQGRADISGGNVAGVNSRLNGLLPFGDMPTTGASTNSTERQHSDEDTAKRINNVLNS